MRVEPVEIYDGETLRFDPGYVPPGDVVAHALRFWNQVKADWHNCQRWSGATRKDQRAYYCFAKRTVTVWEFAWLCHGPLPPNRWTIGLAPTCHDLCVLPYHLRIRAPWRHGRKEGRRQHPFTRADRQLIRQLNRGPFEYGRATLTVREIATRFKVSEREITEILARVG